MRMPGLVGFTALCALAIGCNESKEGAQGLVIFTPDACGVGPCSFDDSIAVSGTIQVNIRGDDEEMVSTAGYELASDDTSVLEVTAIPDVGGRPTWELYAVSEGVARLAAIDDGEEIDFIEVPVQEIDGLELVHFVGEAVGPVQEDNYDEVWTINAGEDVSFHAVPTLAGDRLMGVLEYGYTADEPLDAVLDPAADISHGEIEFNVPGEGEFALSLDAAGVTLDVLFRVVEPQ
jgi:hypothetical protein